MALDRGAHRPRRCLLFELMLETLGFHPEAQTRSRIPWAIFRPLKPAISCFPPPCVHVTSLWTHSCTARRGGVDVSSAVLVLEFHELMCFSFFLCSLGADASSPQISTMVVSQFTKDMTVSANLRFSATLPQALRRQMSKSWLAKLPTRDTSFNYKEISLSHKDISFN